MARAKKNVNSEQRHPNRMSKGKRNKETVIAERTAKKEYTGRVVDDKFDNKIATPVQAKNPTQKEFLSALKTHQVIVFNAPAGCGKSFLTMCEVTDWYKKGLINKIMLSRPAVGMGNTIGLLKGGIEEKYSPLLLPLLDVICSRYGTGFYQNSLSKGSIEMLPLEYIRGRNVEDVAIVDEFQNCTPDEAYTMITRVAEGGKLILLGDPTQNDLRGENAMQWLPKFVEANPELKDFIKVIEATSDDIVRGGLCKLMVKAKEKSNVKGN